MKINYLSPFREVPEAPCDQPVLIVMPGSNAQFISVFSTVEKLRTEMQFIGVTNYKIKEITDLHEFLESVCGYGIRVMLDPIGDMTTGKTKFRPLCQQPEHPPNVDVLV